MTSKERTLCTIHHQQPDRVPVGEWGIDHDHVSHILGRHTYWRNRKDTTLALWDGRRDEVVESMKRDYAQLVDELDYDIITVETVPPKGYTVQDVPRKTGEGRWEDTVGRVFQYAASNDSIQCITSPPELDELDDDLLDEAERRAAAPDESTFELIDWFCERYGGKKAILCRSIDIYGSMMNLFGGGYEYHLMLTTFAQEDILRARRVCYAYNQALIDHCQKVGVDIMMQGHDFGMNTGTIINPASIRELYVPAMAEVNRRTSVAGMVPFFHCCGQIWDVLDDFVASGYKGYQSIQESAGMDNARMKREYGDALTLWTGVQCETLVDGTLAQVEAEVERNLELLMPGGGFIFGSTNSVQYGAKTENYLRALELVRSRGVYR